MCKHLEGVQTCNHGFDGSMFICIKWGNVLIPYTNYIFSDLPNKLNITQW